MMKHDRRVFLSRGVPLLVGGAAAATAVAQQPAEPAQAARSQRFAVSTYSFWQFRRNELRDIETCIDLAAKWGFDGVELLHVQMQNEDNSYLQRLKRRAFVNGLDLCGFSTHQGFLSPDSDVRKKNIDHTIHCIELAYKLGIPTMRVNTGRWGTTETFDELMKNRGIEPVLAGHTEEEGFSWVIESLEQCLPAAERCGVLLGLENHWGLGRTAQGVLRVVDAINSPWLQVTADTGNFLDDTYEQFEALLTHAVFVQAKTYYGGGLWYALELDYARFARLLRQSGYNGYVSLEFEGREDPRTGIPQSLAMLKSAFA